MEEVQLSSSLGGWVKEFDENSLRFSLKDRYDSLSCSSCSRAFQILGAFPEKQRVNDYFCLKFQRNQEYSVWASQRPLLATFLKFSSEVDCFFQSRELCGLCKLFWICFLLWQLSFLSVGVMWSYRLSPERSLAAALSVEFIGIRRVFEVPVIVAIVQLGED